MSIYDRSDYKRGGYSAQRGGNFNRGSFQPKKPVHTFRDLEVYQKAMDCAVIIGKDVAPILENMGNEVESGKKGKRDGLNGKQSRHGDVKYPMLENMVNCALSIPLYIGEGHSMRFDSFAAGIALLEKAMAGCNKMIVYLEQVKGLYGVKLDGGLLDDLIGRYVEARSKMFRLSKSWKKFHQEYPEGKFANSPQAPKY